MVIVIVCLIAGVLAALYMPYNIPSDITKYVAIAILAGIDSIFGGIVANMNHNFKLKIFLSGFFGNAILAALITYMGTLLNVDLSIAAIVVFGTRLFQNFAMIRRMLLNKLFDDSKQKKL